MTRLSPDFLDSDVSDWWMPADVLFQRGSNDEEDEEEDENDRKRKIKMMTTKTTMATRSECAVVHFTG